MNISALIVLQNIVLDEWKNRFYAWKKRKMAFGKNTIKMGC